eukprot:749497-Hanusia_phi.AAC.5
MNATCWHLSAFTLWMDQHMDTFTTTNDHRTVVKRFCNTLSERQPEAARGSLEKMAKVLMDVGSHKLVHNRREGPRKLLDHLFGTMKILVDAGYPHRTCAAGLFHSIYGTSIFKHTSIEPDQRGRGVVRDIVGEEAESLVWLFHTIDRPRTLHDSIVSLCTDRASTLGEEVALDKTDGTTIVVNGTQFEDLVAVEIANLLDQGPLNTTRWPGFQNCEAYIRIHQEMANLQNPNASILGNVQTCLIVPDQSAQSCLRALSPSLCPPQNRTIGEGPGYGRGPGKSTSGGGRAEPMGTRPDLLIKERSFKRPSLQVESLRVVSGWVGDTAGQGAAFHSGPGPRAAPYGTPAASELPGRQ